MLKLLNSTRPWKPELNACLNEAFQRAGWSRDPLLARHKGDPRKVDIARELRAHTTMPLSWIAQQLHMGSRGYVAWLLQRPKAVSPSDTQRELPSENDRQSD